MSKKIRSGVFDKNFYTLNQDQVQESPKIRSGIFDNTRSISGLAYVGGKIGLGVLGVVEGATDFIAGTVARIFGDKDYKDYVFQYDNWVQDLNTKLDEAYNPKKVGRFVGDVSSGLGQSVTFLIPYVGQVLFALGIWGNAISSASQKTGETGFREYAYGAGSAAVEWALERFISGSGQTLESLGKNTVKNIGSKVTKSLGKQAAKTTTTKMIAAQLVSSAGGEAVEEFLGSVWDPVWQRWTGVDDEAKVDWGDALYSGLVGFASGGIMGGVSTSVQTAYEAKRGADLNTDAKKRDAMLKEVRYLVENAEAQGLTSGSDTVAGLLAELKGGLTSYQNAKDKNGAGATIALGKLERTLAATELNVITDRHAEYIASLSKTEHDQLAEWANAYFKDAGIEITAEDLTNVDHQITRAIATMDWVGRVVDTSLGKNRVLNEEIAAQMEKMQLDEEERKNRAKEATVKAEVARRIAEAEKVAKPVSEGATWNGENATYVGEYQGEKAYLTIEKNDDGSYRIFLLFGEKGMPVTVSAEKVKSAIAKLSGEQDTENADTQSLRSQDETHVTEDTDTAENAEKAGERGTKMSLEESFASRIDSWDKKTEGFSFIVGQTSSVLQQIEVGGKKIGKKQIRIDASKIKKILSDHKEMTIEVFKKIPEVLESPILVLESKTVSGRIVLFGELYDDRGRLIQIIMELNPSTKSGKSTYLDVVKIASAYAKDNAQNLINTSKILYVDKNRSRVEDWLKVNRLQLPLPSSQSDSASEDSISQTTEKSNTSKENSSKSSLGPDSVSPKEDDGTPKKPSEEYVETEFKATPQEVKAAMKAVKQFKFLDAETREAIINMMRSAGGIDKVTVQSIAAFMAVRSGLQVRFMKDHREEGSHDVLKKSGRRLILLDPDKMNGKHWRADIFFHELYHDMAATGDLKGLTKAIYETADPAFQHAVADLYTAHYNKGVSLSKFLNGKKWTEARVKEYFETYKGISFEAMMEEVAAGTMGRVMGSKKFIRSLRQVGILKRTYYNIAELVQSIANRAITVGGDNTAGFTLMFRDALGYKALYSRAVIESETDLSPEAIAELKKVLEEAAEMDEDRARTKFSFAGYAEDGKGKYKSNFPKGTPKSAKAAVILDYIQNVWSKKPIKLKIKENGIEREIEAQFDPTYSEDTKIRTDATKLMGGNRHGSASEQRVTLDLADDYYQIASEATYNYSKDETGKESYTHQGVKRWHYFINDIYFAEYGSEEYEPYRVTINVKEKENGNFVYSFSAEEQGDKKRKSDAQQTLHAAVSGAKDTANIELSDNSISQPTPKVNSKLSLSFDSTENQLTEEQDAYFKDSKVRDAQGRLQVMYQGAAEEFYTFEKKKSKPSNLYGRGFYFTNSADQARHYGTVRPYYLNITNPLATQEKTISRLQMRKFLKAVSENEDYSIENYGTYDIEKILQSVYEGKSDFAMIYDVSLTAIGDLVEATELFNGINGTAYDGFILDTEAVTFKSEQAKLTANIAPTSNPDTRYSLSLDGAESVTAEAVQADLDRVKWGFEWTDAKLLDNINTVRRYLEKKYPDHGVSLEIDNENKRVIVTDISRNVDFDEVATYDARFADFLRSIDVPEAEIASHLTAFTPSQKAKAVDTVTAKKESSAKEKPARPRAYYKNQVATATNAILSQIITPMAGGEAKMLGKDKTKLINWLWRKMNSAKNQAERRKIANAVAEGFIARTIYADLEVNAEYEQMLVDGTIENFNVIDSYRGKIKADTVKADVFAKYDKKKGAAVLKRWTAEDGISIGDAIAELQDQGLLTDVTAKNEADLLIALNEEYERLKGLTDLRREFVPLALADETTVNEIRQNVSDIMMGFFRSGGKETKYSKLLRRYQELIAEKDAQHQKEIEELEAKLNEAFAKRIDQVRQEADRQINRAKERFDRRLTEANYGRDYARRLNRISADGRRLRDYVNRDYTAADQMEDRQTRGIAKAFLKAMTRTGVKAQQARDAARLMLAWAENAQKDNENFIGTDPMQSAMTQEELDTIKLLAASGQVQTLTDEELKEFGISREKYEAVMEEQRAKESLSLEELEEFHTALKVAIRNYQNYDMFWNGERWIGLNEIANEAVAIIQEGNEKFQKKGLLYNLGRGIRKIAMPFLDPLSVAASIDGFRYDGVFQDLVLKLAYAEAEKNKMVIEFRRPFEEFLEKNKKYQKRLSEEIIELEDGFKITVGQAISLTELNKRDQAKTALAISRLAFRMDDGTVRKLEGFDKLPQITTPSGQKISLVKAQELVKGLQITPDTAIAELKEKGYTEKTLSEFEKAVSKAEAEAMPLIAQFGESRQQLIAKIEKQLTAEDRAFIKVVSDFFQKTSKEAKTKADLRNLGYTNVIDGYYFPIKRRAADIAKDISDGTPFTDFITTVNLSFNQSIVPNAKASIDVANVWDVVTEHINGLAMWEHLYLPIQNINKIYNKNVNTGTGTTNVLSVKSLLDERTEAKYGAWLKDLLLDVQGARQRETKTIFDTAINKIRGTYAVYQLGFNPQTVVKQTLSWAAAAQYLSPASIAKGIAHPRLNAKELDRVSAVAAERMGEATVVKALSNTEKVSKIGEKTMWGISKMDRFVNETLFAMCQEEVAAKDPKKPIGSEANLVEAGKLVSEVILKVQDSSDMATKSQAARSSNELVKAFTMFQSAALKMFSRLFENVGFVMNYKQMSAEDQAKYGAQYKKAQRQLARSVGSAAAVAVLTAIIVQAFKFLYDKDREDKDGNEITVAEDLATDAATEIVGFIPVVGDVVDYFVNGYEMSNFFEDTANDTLKAFSQTFSLMGKVASGDVIEDWEVGSMLRKVSRAAGSLTGIPVRNVENVLSGLTRRFFPKAGYTYDTLFYNANYTEDINKALKSGDTELATAILELMMKRDKTGATYSAETLDTIVQLHNVGYDVFPKSPETDDMNRKTYRKFISAYQQADSAVEKLVKSAEFKAMADYATDESSPQASAIKTLYTGYYDLAEHDVLGKELTRSAAYFTVTDPHDLVLVKAYDRAIKLETVEKKGSREAMLKAYMKKLGMDKTAQAYAAYACGYRNNDIKTTIFADLKGKENENELLIALGLKEAENEEKEDAA